MLYVVYIHSLKTAWCNLGALFVHCGTAERFFSIDSVRSRVHLKVFFFLIQSWMSCMLPLILCTTVLNKVLLAALEPLNQPAKEPSSEKYSI